MEKIYFILFVIVLLFSCYEDKGNYDYKELEGITVTLPETSYSLFFGDKLQITPIIESSIPDEDLAFDWGIEDSNVWYSGSYITIDSSRVLDFVCETDDYLLKQEGVYNLRLHVTQVSTGRNFYSDAISVKLSERGLPSYTGAIVLHGDGTSSDIGVIVADEFQLKGNSSNGKTQVFSHYYSEVNGETIKGKGQWILQLYPYGNAMYSDNIVVVAVTDEGAAVTDKSMMKEGGWNDLFYGGLNEGVPRGCCMNYYNIYAFDGGDVFMKQLHQMFVVPTYDDEEMGWVFYPKICFAEIGGPLSGLLFDETNRRFMGLTSVNYFTYEPLVVDESESLPFNPVNVQADLIYMDGGGKSGHVLAVMKKDNGDHFIAEFDLTASSYSDVPVYAYDLMHIADVQNGEAINWAFSSSYINMCYYATGNGVYRFAVESGNTINPEALKMTDGSPLVFDGEITLMKILNPVVGENEYYMAKVEMVVATYGGVAGSGKLYSIEIDPFAGLAKKVKVYTGFDRIYDVNIKGF